MIKPSCQKCSINGQATGRIIVTDGPHDQGNSFITCECSKEKDRVPGEKK